MEPRIRSLLLDDSLAIDKLPQDQLPFPLAAYNQQHALPHHGSRPAPVEPSAPRATNFQLHDIYSPAPKDHAVFSSQRPGVTRHHAEKTPLPHEQRNGVSRPTKSVPLAEVLNNEQASSSFSGSVNDLLLNDGASRKRRKVDGNEIFTLPKPFPVKKGSRRPRIPPLLQGLHQPPPDAGLFPPITGERVAREAPKVLTEPKATKTPESPAKPDATKEADKPTAGKAQEPAPIKKRKKWTEQETTHLLKGVAQFGIGNWKKILSCSDYSFDGRTAVDLKDRFRTCCPDEYRKLKAPLNAEKDKSANSTGTEGEFSSTKPVSSLVASNILHPRSPTSIGRPEKKKRGPKVHRKDVHDLVSMGIDAPFKKKARRERREFTEQEDAALLRGVEKLGPHWHAIRNDPELELTSRHPTDLRDRFRNRWPEKYAEAGYKIHLKGKDSKKDREDTATASDTPVEKAQLKKSSLQDEPAISATANAGSSSSTHPASATKPRAPTDLKSLLATYPFRDPFEDDDDGFASDMPFEGECSPVILSRDIFSYAHPSNGNQTTSILDLPASAADHSHINPLDTLKIPRLSTGHQSSSTSLPPVWLTAPLTAGLTEANSSANPKPRSESRNLGSGLVSVSGSGSGTVSLPGPADLLMGLDFDGRNDAHGPGGPGFSLWDELPGPGTLS